MEAENTAEVRIDLTKSGADEKINEENWLNLIKSGLELEEDEEVKEPCISIFNVPKQFSAVNPKAFIPQTISIGPYHHWRSELYDMERYKIAAARRFRKRIDGQKFESVVDEISVYDIQIRRCYERYVDYSKEALAWLMALDTSFVLDCLQFYVNQAGHASSGDFTEVKQLGKVLDPTGRSASHNAIVRDLMMLENQIPLFLLCKLLEIELGAANMAEERACNLVRLACMEVSPFKFKFPDNSKLRIQERGHILEVLYYCVVPLSAMDDFDPKGNETEQQPQPEPTIFTKMLQSLWKAVASLNVGHVRQLKLLLQRAYNGRAVQVVLQPSFRFVSALGKSPVLNAFKSLLTALLKSYATVSKDSSMASPPTRDELAVPSVSDLYSAGIKFLPTEGDLTTIHFDEKTATLYLPKLVLDANAEVILRNLVAFEAAAAPGAMILARYTEFMDGIIDKEEDVRLLRKRGIIFNHLESDEKAASLWSGMGREVKLTRVKYLDKVIADVNKHYSGRWSVTVKEYLKTYVFKSWKFLTFLSAVVLLLLTFLDAFCSVYVCKKWFNDSSILEEEN